ncbi:MAG: hypothetical protein L3J50_03980 [Emcibacter sp.]|nr:hypothetical protein [Emcibacter sp.]
MIDKVIKEQFDKYYEDDTIWKEFLSKWSDDNIDKVEELSLVGESVSDYVENNLMDEYTEFVIDKIIDNYEYYVKNR